MEKLPKKPKALKYPKRPKSTASLETWQNYVKKCDEIDKRNRERLRDWERKVKEIESREKKRQSLMKTATKKR